MIIPVITLFIASKRLGLLLEREIPLSMEIDERQNIDRLRLFQTASAIYTVGAALSLLVGYFGMKKGLNKELLLAGFVLMIGLFTRSIPIISKKHAAQNTMFLCLNTMGMMFFMTTDAKVGALTIWAIYILFLLFTVILDSNIPAAVFTVLAIAMQIILSFIFPKLQVPSTEANMRQEFSSSSYPFSSCVISRLNMLQRSRGIRRSQRRRRHLKGLLELHLGRYRKYPGTDRRNVRNVDGHPEVRLHESDGIQPGL